jgi:predicted secreted hydrolase
MRLPEDMGPHPWAQTEWWHLHADLVAPDSGVTTHVFAGFIVERSDLDRVLGVPVRWFADPVHVAWVRIQGERTHVAERVAFPDLWAARFVGDGLDLRHGDWRLAWRENGWDLAINAGPERLDLRFIPAGAAVTPGDGGVVELEPGSRHQWLQHDGLRVTGTLRRGLREHAVEGHGFCKHQWGRLYTDRYDGFEWFTVDLGNPPRTLSILWLLDGARRGAPGSRAWIAGTNGAREDLVVEDLRVTPLRAWRSRCCPADWPVAWKIEGAGLDLTVEAADPAQELCVFPLPIHLGPAHARGRVEGVSVDGPAFAEQAGAWLPPFRWALRSEAPADL